MRNRRCGKPRALALFDAFVKTRPGSRHVRGGQWEARSLCTQPRPARSRHRGAGGGRGMSQALRGSPTTTVVGWAFAGPALLWAGSGLFAWRVSNLVLSAAAGRWSPGPCALGPTTRHRRLPVAVSSAAAPCDRTSTQRPFIATRPGWLAYLPAAVRGISIRTSAPPPSRLTAASRPPCAARSRARSTGRGRCRRRRGCGRPRPAETVRMRVRGMPPGIPASVGDRDLDRVGWRREALTLTVLPSGACRTALSSRLSPACRSRSTSALTSRTCRDV